MRIKRAIKRFDSFAFRSAAWALLFVIFVFALVPTGFLQARAIGSAFDPSTSIVSLKDSSRQGDQRKMAAHPANQPDRPTGIGVALANSAAVSAWKIATSEDRARLALPRYELEFQPGLSGNFFRARAPPLG